MDCERSDASKNASGDGAGRPANATIEERVNAAIEKIRPGIAADGGEVWLVKVEDGVAYVQMLGACGGCPASMMTLKGAIETIVRAEVPEIREVVEL
jgi:Fe-S cluster biogenesis protein NfuA